MFTRFQDIQTGAIDDTGMSINNVAEALARVKNASGESIQIVDRQTGQFRSFQDVLNELWPVWNKLNDVEQANITKALAGVRQANILRALLENQAQATSLLTAETNSAGLANERYAIYLKSVEAAQNNMKASWEGLWQATVSSGAIKWFYDLGAAILQALTNMGGLIPVIGAVTAAIVLLQAKSVVGFFVNLGLTITSNITTIWSFVGVLNGALNTALTTSTTLTEALTVAFGGTAVAVGSVIAIIAALTAVVITYKKEVADRQAQGLEDSGTAWKNTISGITNAGVAADKYKEKIRQLNDDVKQAGIIGSLFIDKNKITEQGFREVAKVIGDTSTSYSQYKTNMQEVIDAAGYMVDAQGKIYKEIWTSHGPIKQYIDDMTLLTESNFMYTKVGKKTATTTTEITQTFEGVAKVITDLSKQIEVMNGVIANAQSGKLSFDDINKLAAVYPDYLNALKEEGGQLELNTDKVKQYQLAQAQKAIDDAKAKGATQEEIAILTNYYDQLNRGIALSRDYTDNFQEMLSAVNEGSGGNAGVVKLTNNLAELNRMYEQGEIDASAYFGQMNDQLKGMDFSQTFANNQQGAQEFFSGLVLNATQALSQISSEFNAGKIDITTYSDELLKLTDVFNTIGSIVQTSGGALGLSPAVLDSVTAALGGVSEGAKTLADMQNMNKDISAAWQAQTAGNLQFQSEAFNNSMRAIAETYALSGQTFVDINGNAITGADQMYSYLTAKAGNFATFANKMGNNTGKAIQQIVSNIGKMLVSLGNAIKNFKFSITPKATGRTMKFPATLMGKVLNFLQVPEITIEPNVSGLSAANIGAAISSFGSGLTGSAPEERGSGGTPTTAENNWDAKIYGSGDSINQVTKSAGGASNAMKDLAKNIGGAGSAAKEQAKNIDALLKIVESKIKQEAEAQKQNLKNQLDGYKKLIDIKKKILQTMKEEKDFNDSLAEKQKGVISIQNELAVLQLDNSEESKAKQLKLKEDLANKQADIDKMQYDKSIKDQQAALDNEYKGFETFTNDKIAQIDNFLKEPGAIAQEALAQIDANAPGFYDSLISWNKVYGDGINQTITKAWNDAYTAMMQYGNAASSTKVGQEVGGAGVINYNPPLPPPVHPYDPNAPKYHDGGFVGGLKSNEEFARLLKGELVLTKSQMANFSSSFLNSPNVDKSGGRNISIEKLLDITVNGNLDKSVIPDIENIANQVLEKINNVVYGRGYVRPTNLYTS